MEFRVASADESELLCQMVLDGVAHWGHDVNFPDAVAGLRASGMPDRDFISANLVEVLVDGTRVAGFYSLTPSGDDVELVHMFVASDRIGTGCGRRLWERAVARAASAAPRMMIMADPQAKTFYTAMGARLERDVEVSPGFSLGLMWYELGGATDR